MNDTTKTYELHIETIGPYTRDKFAMFLYDLGFEDEWVIDEEYDRFLKFHTESEEDLGEGNFGTLIEVVIDSLREETKVHMSSYDM
jgi:hypothetical protein